jgi:hypothetical protein
MSSDRKPLKEEVEDLVLKNGGWLYVIPRLTNAFDDAIRNLGKPVDCPFPGRHKASGGVDDFRFSEDPKYEGRAICTCMPDGMGPVDLLLEDGCQGSNYVSLMCNIRDVLSGRKHAERRLAPAIVRKPVETPAEEEARKKAKLSRIAKGVVKLNHPSAKSARLYFRRRGIPLNANIEDVRFHPALEYFDTRKENGKKVKVFVGRFPAIVSAFRDKSGRVINLHKIYITEDGKKASVTKVKKIDSPLMGFKSSSIPVATVQGCRTLHVTEGVEKGWAIHLATGQSVKASYAHGTLPSIHVAPEDFDEVVIWSDNDPFNEKTGKHGAGQTSAWKLFLALLAQGFKVTLMVPVVDHVPGAKGPDWEDLIVSHSVLEMPAEQRMPFLRTLADAGGVTDRWKCKRA